MRFLVTTSLILFLHLFAYAQEEVKDAMELYQGGDYVGVVTHLEKLNAATGGTNRSFLLLGAAYAQIGKDDEARATFLKARKLRFVATIEGEILPTVKVNERPGTTGIPDPISNGSTLLAVELRNDKTVGLIFVVSSTNDEFAKSCIDAAKKIGFDPATSNGKPVTVIKFFEYIFSRY